MNSLKNITAYMRDGLKSVMYFDDDLKSLPDFELIEVRTEDVYDTIDLPTIQSRSLKIQTRYQNKYRLEFFTTGNVNITYLRLANYLTVELNSGEIFYVETNDISLTEIQQFSQYKCTVNLYRLALGEEQIINYLTYPEIRGKDEFGEYILDEYGLLAGVRKIHAVKLLYNSVLYEYYTIINPILSISETKLWDNERNNTKYLDRSINFNQLEVLLYLTETQKNEMVAIIQDSTVNAYITDGTNVTTYTALEYIVPEIRKIESAYKMFECRIIIKYQLNEFNA
jgi:hypothetical protein